MMTLGSPQSASQRRFRKTFAHCMAVNVSLPGTSATLFEYLHVIDIAELSPSLESRRASMKSIVSVWNGTDGDCIGCKEPYGE